MRTTNSRVTQIFGDYLTTLPQCQEELSIVVAPTAFPIEWSLAGVTANFLASYFDPFFPPSNEAEPLMTTREEAWDAISYVCNELMENSMKFHHDKRIDMVVNIKMYHNLLIIMSSNSVDPATLVKFYAFIADLTAGDPMELYIRHLEEGLESLEKTTSGIGFLTILANYAAKIGWKFDIMEENPKIVNVTTMVQLPICKEAGGSKVNEI